jgi:hypothetical protein
MSRRALRMAAAAALLPVLIAACAGPSPHGSEASKISAGDLQVYVTQVEQVRLPVNQLLNGADPILNAYHDHAISPAEATRRMDALERSFAGYVLAMALIHPTSPPLSQINAPYAHTYLQEDSYLSALAADLTDGNFENLPNTQNDQRLAIIAWRTQLEVLATQTHVHLPTDLQQAGRGEIAPSPAGS